MTRTAGMEDEAMVGKGLLCKMFLSSLLLVLVQVGSTTALDYLIKPVPPDLVKDEATTFLADFSRGKIEVEHAAGPSQVNCPNPAFTADGGLRGNFTFARDRNFNLTQWTLEVICRVPEGVSQDLPLGTWEAPGNWRANLQLSLGAGATFRLDAPRARGRQHPFHASAHAGGNGFSIQKSAANEWVYLAFGLDLRRQKVMVVARGLDGHILKKNANFTGKGGLNTDFVRSLPEAQQAVALAQCWEEMRRTISEAAPAAITLGNSNVEIKRLRVSNRFRDEVFLLQPDFGRPDAVAVFSPEQINAARSKTRTVTRRLGYPGYNNFVTPTIEEKFIPLAADSPPLEVALPELKRGLYSFYIYGTIAAQGRENLPRVWQPCPMEFTLRDKDGKKLTQGRMLLKQGLTPRRMQGFHFHILNDGDYIASFSVTPKAMETAEILYVQLVDQLANLPDVPVKEEQNLAQGRTAQLKTLTAERQRRDDFIWASLPPLNVHLQVHGQVKEFREPPAGAPVGKWVLKAYDGVRYPRANETFTPLDFIDQETKQVFPHDKVVAGEPWPGALPDDGTGIFLRKADYPDLLHDIYYCSRAVALGHRVQVYLGLLGVWDYRGLSLPQQYFEKGDPNVGHDAALALVRLAWDWPALEMNLHEIRLCTHAPDFEFNTDWSLRRNGKYFYDGWSGDNFVELLRAYDQVFPYIKDNQVFADAVHRFIPWVKTPQDVVRLLDRYLVFAGVRDFNERGLIRAAPVEEIAAQVMGVHPLTVKWFDLTRAYANIYPARGTYQELYATALPRNGAYYIGSFMVYAFGACQDTLKKAHAMAVAKQKGVSPIMDLSDVGRYRKVKAAGQFLLDIFTAGGFPLTVGDASGGPHTGLEAEKRLRAAKESSEIAFRLWGDARHAWLLQHLHGNKSPEVAQVAAGVKNPLLHQYSRVVPNEAAVVELGSEETDVTRKTSMMLRLGVGQGHAHHDQLDLNIFAMGLPITVDLACRNEGNNWSRPGAAWSFLHNHAIAHTDLDPRNAGNRSGEPWLRAFAPPLLRGSYVSADGKETLERDVILMEVGDSGTYYAFDLQRVKGGNLHTWCFHGCESESVEVNTPMVAAEDHRWLSRLLEGTRKAGKAPATLHATWTMTRRPRQVKHNFSGGGVINTVACEPTVLGNRYNPNLPEVRVRATLLGRGGDDVLQGDAYSQAYSYCFPFLWVQAQAQPDKATLYPAVYEWYRGTTPVVAKAELVRSEPLTVQVMTTTGQQDTYILSGEAFIAISRDAKGLRWARLSGGIELVSEELRMRAARAKYATIVTEMDYVRGTLVTRDPLPANPHAVIGNPGRWSNLALRGSGTTFTFDDDLLIHEGAITDIRIIGDDSISVETNQKVLFADFGNRKLSGLTQANEAGTWLFRGGKVIRRPAGEKLTKGAFTDANGDGFVNLKTYEAGVGDAGELLADVTVRRTAAGDYEVQTNVPVSGEVRGRAFNLEAKEGWQRVQ